MKFASLFAGIGGFDLGFERAGMECALQVERDADCCSVLARHWPSVPRLEDVRDAERIDADLISGGFPCQDVSVAGRRAGLAGERSGLWFEFHRILAASCPRWVVVENVPGLLSSNGGRDFAVILQGLVELGYGVCWRVLDAQYFGVAQRRRRVFIVGHLGDGRAAEVLFEPESVSGNPEEGEGEREIVAALTANGVGAGGGADDNAAQAGHVIGTIAGFEKHNLCQATALVSVALRGRNGGAQIELGGERAFALCSSQGGSDKGMVASMGGGIRRLTPTECERLQGFPDGWTDGQSDAARYRQLGNAVAVPVAEWIGKRIVLRRGVEK